MSSLPWSVSRDVRLDGETLRVPDRTGASRPLFRALQVLAGALGMLGLCRRLGLFGEGVVQVVEADARGVRCAGRACPWAGVRRIGVAPYPFVDGSYVYCVELRASEGVAMRLGPGLSRRELDGLAAHLEGLRARHAAARASQPAEDLDALDLLVGTLRDR